MKRTKGIAWLYREIPGLVQAGIFSNETADKLRSYYGEVQSRSRMNMALSIFGVVGAVCMGLGVILLFAYNWDMFSRVQRTMIAFLPLLLSQLFVGWTFFAKKNSFALREGGGVFNMLSIGATIALISQIYHIPGDIDTFMLSWMVLALPLVYFLQASLPAVLYLIGITTWAGFAQTSGGHAVLFWPLVVGILPHYLKHLKEDPYSSRSVWLSSAVCLCLTVGMGISLEKVLPGLWIIAYSSFFTCLYLLNKIYFDDAPAPWQRPFRNYGIMGVLILSYLFTFKWVWSSIGWSYWRYSSRYYVQAGYMDYIVTIGLFVAAVCLFVRVVREKRLLDVSYGALPILSVLGYALSGGLQANPYVAVWCFNLYVLYLGIIAVMTGFKERQLGIANAGILIMGGIIFTRFVDASLGIIERSIIFMIIGACFIGANMFFSKKMNQEVSHEG